MNRTVSLYPRGRRALRGVREIGVATAGAPRYCAAMPKPVPLAWYNLAHDRVRFTLFAAGVGFAVVLMGVQYGIMNAMLDSNTVIIERLDCDLVLVNPNRASLLMRGGVSQRRAEQARAAPGVRAAIPVYLEYQAAGLRHTARDSRDRTQTRRIRVVGVDPESGILNLPDVSAEA